MPAKKMWICCACVCVVHRIEKDYFLSCRSKKEHRKFKNVDTHIFYVWAKNDNFFLLYFPLCDCVLSLCFYKMSTMKENVPSSLCGLHIWLLHKKVSEVQVLLLLKKVQKKRTRCSQSLVHLSTVEVHKIICSRGMIKKILVDMTTPSSPKMKTSEVQQKNH